jgi:hypothetical protein
MLKVLYRGKVVEDRDIPPKKQIIGKDISLARHFAHAEMKTWEDLQAEMGIGPHAYRLPCPYAVGANEDKAMEVVIQSADPADVLGFH